MKRTTKNFFLTALLPLLTSLLLAGCASTKAAQTPAPKTNILGDHAGMERSLTGKQVYLYTSPDAKAGVYTHYIADQVLMFTRLGPFDGGENPARAEKTAKLFLRLVAKTMQDRYVPTDEAGPGTLRLRTAFTDIWPTDGGENDTLMALGGISLEAEFVDSVTGKRVASVFSYRHAKGLGRRGGTPDETSQWVLRRWSGLVRSIADQIELQ